MRGWVRKNSIAWCGESAARTWGEIWHVGGLAMTLRDEAFRLRAPNDFSRIDWLYGDRVA